MGFDISSNEPNREKAEEFAKKYEYTYLFDKDTGEYKGDSSLYFRANIWGMSDIHRIIELMRREIHQDTDYGLQVPMPIIDKTTFNDGTLVTTSDILDFLDLVNYFTGAKKDDGVDKWIERIRDNVYPIVLGMIRAKRLANPDMFKATVSTFVDGKLVDKEYPDEDAANDSTNLFVEFVDYANACLELEGFRVY